MGTDTVRKLTDAQNRCYSLRRFIVSLVQSITSPNSAIPLNTGQSSTAQIAGVVLAFPQHKHYGSKPATWFEPLAARWGLAPLFEANHRRVVPIVNWEILLSKAVPRLTTEANTDTAIQKTAYLLWFLLTDFVAAFDYAFADELRCRGSIEDTIALDAVLFPTTMQARRRQLFAYYQQRFLRNKVFVRPYLRQTMHALFSKRFSYSNEEASLPRCRVVTRHVRGANCSECATIAWMHTNTSVLNLDNLMSYNLVSGMVFQPITPKPLFESEFTNPWLTELRVLLDANTPLMGAVRIPDSDLLLINWATVAENAEAWRHHSPVQKCRDVAFPTDDNLAGLAARRYMERFHAEAPRTEPLDVVQRYGWPSYDPLRTPCELYSYTKLLTFLRRSGVSLDTLRKRDRYRRRSVAPRSTRKAKIVKVSYTDEQGHTCDIRVIRRQRLTESGLAYVNHYELPFLGDVEDPKERRDLATRLHGVTYWCERGLNKLSNLSEGFDAQGDRILRYPEAEHFLRWAGHQEVRLNKAEFNTLLYDGRTNDRVAEFLSGKRKSMSRFSPSELETLRRILEETQTRRDDRPNVCAAALPGRSWNGIRRQIEILGYEYALEHGYAVYELSPYFINYSIARRRRWAKKGVKDIL